MENKQEPNRWHTSLLKWMRPYQFNWIGRTKDGVNRWIGAPRGPSERICKYLIRYGVMMGIAGLVATAALLMRVESSVPLSMLALVGTIHGLVFTIMAVWLRRMRRSLARLKTVEELAEEFGATPETVRTLAETHGIRARININSDNLFDPDEFVASRSLLRGASAPYSSASLLRAAEPAATTTAPDTLLRPAEAGRTAMTPVQQLFFAPEQADEPEETQPLRR